MTTSFAVIRTARKQHRCGRCLLPIRPGTRYTAYRIPPGGELGNTRWVSGTEHEQSSPGLCAPSTEGAAR